MILFVFIINYEMASTHTESSQIGKLEKGPIQKKEHKRDNKFDKPVAAYVFMSHITRHVPSF